MTIDARARMICSLGPVISGQIGDDLLSDTGVIRTTGTIVLKGLILPRKGSSVQLAYERPQAGRITRFPRALRVLRANADPYAKVTTVDVGCVLALKEGYVRKADSYRAADHGGRTISAQSLLRYCARRLGLTLAAGGPTLRFRFLRSEVDLSAGYVAVIGDLLISHCCYGYVNLSEQLVVKRIKLDSIGTAPVIADADLIDLQPATGGAEPADVVTVAYTAIRSA